MNADRPSWPLTLATLGLAFGGPVTLLSGLITLATIPRGIPPAVVVIFVFAAGVTALSALVYLAERARNP